MESEEIIRACALKPGNIFRRGQTRFKIRKIENGRIYFHYFGPSNITSLESIGANSQERVILITNKTKQNEH